MKYTEFEQTMNNLQALAEKATGCRAFDTREELRQYLELIGELK